MKKFRFSEIEEDIIRKAVAQGIKPAVIAEALSLNGTPRITRTIARKIWKMGLEYPEKTEKKKKESLRKYTLRKKPAPEKSSDRKRLNSNITDEWEKTLVLMNVKIVLIHGKEIFAINGVPVSIWEIRERSKNV